MGRTRLNRNAARIFVISWAVVGLCAFQYGDKYNLNSMPFAQVSRLTSDLAEARRLAKKGNIDLLAGQALQGTGVRLRGELTDANCLLSSHQHSYDHAFCAKLCVAAGSPLVFLADEGGQVYLVLPPRNAAKISDLILDRIGIPGSTVTGKIVSSGNLTALAVDAIHQ